MPHKEIKIFGKQDIIFGIITHDKKSDRTSLVVYANAGNETVIRESRISNDSIPQKDVKLKQDILKEKEYLIDKQNEHSNRKKKINDIFKEHGYDDVKNPVTAIQMKIYPKPSASKSTFYRRYLFPGKDHMVRFSLTEYPTDQVIFEYGEQL